MCKNRATIVISFPGVLTLLGLCLMPGVHTQLKLPDVIIGEPNDPLTDVIGKPLSEMELEASSADVTTGLNDGGQDAITRSGFYQGDIVIESQDLLYQIIEGSADVQTSAVRNPSLKWPSGIVPYVISSSFSHAERRVIGAAMQMFHLRTCIQFINRQGHPNYIHILKGRGCSSSVGRIGGVQVVSLGEGCITKGITVHEFMHVIGFWHEQSRGDRDQYVQINWSNILPYMRFNFDKKSNWLSNDLGQPYDYFSVMHYGSHDFAINPSVPTIIPKVRGIAIGQRRGASRLDIDGINILYQCKNVAQTTPRPPAPKKRPFTIVRSTTTTSSPITTYKPTLKPSQTCYDADKSCWVWAKSGKCEIDPSLRKYLCKKSCGTCETTPKQCEDVNASCTYWREIGECLKNPTFMHSNCRVSCGICSS